MTLADVIESYLAPDACYSDWRPSGQEMRTIIAALRAQTPEATEPVAWIASNVAGKAIHFAKADGWQIDVVQTIAAKESK
jgi:hypothetical protein